MKMKISFLLILIGIFLLSSMAWSADKGFVTNVTGRVEYKLLSDSNSWKPVVKGMQLTKDMVLKINQSSLCVIRVDSNIIEFNQASLYPLKAILAQPNRANTLIGNMNRLTLIQNNHNVSSVAGVRAADATDEKDELLLLEDDFATDDPLKDANYFLNLTPPNYSGAIASLSAERLTALTAGNKARGYYLLGWSYFQLGQMEQSTEAFTDALQVQAIEKEIQGKSLLFQAMALYQTGQYAESLTAAETILGNNQLKSFWKEALTVGASNYLMLNNESKANEYFDRIENEFLGQ